MEKKGNINHHKENPEGFIVSELSKKISVSRQTVSNCFAFLEGAEKVKTRQTGMLKFIFGIKKEDENEKCKIIFGSWNSFN